MCGIAGIVSFQHGKINLPTVIKKMTDTIHHRGPDGEGFLFCSEHIAIAAFGDNTPTSVINSHHPYSPQKNIQEIENNFSLAFGHRRLSIIDLSDAGHQPMSSHDKKLWIIYNGEIYNYIEIREELKTKGYTFYTASDTEVILNAYCEWGKECVNKFNGMWAFVIYDTAKQILFGSRDRIGVKPLYYILNDDCFAFASEQKVFLKSGLVKAEMNRKAVFDYFVFSKMESEDEGMFANIFELNAASSFEFSLTEKKLRKWKYYSLHVNEEYEKFDATKFQNLVVQTKEKIFDAIALRLRSDVSVGSCLSGGLDSSTIVGVMNQLLKNENKKINVFTCGFEDEKIDEGKWAKQMVDATNSDWKRTFPNAKELLADLETLTYCQDIPIWSTSTYAQYRVMQLVKENGVKVILDGQGGDELFAGYPHHQTAYMRELILNGKFTEANSLLKSFGNFPANANWFSKQYLKHIGFTSLPSSMLPFVYKKYFEHLQYLHPDFWNQYKERFAQHWEIAPKTLNGMLHHETTGTLLKGYLKCEDRCSMWHSVESRTPFADDIPLMELAFQTPSSNKIHNNTSKYILREAMRGILPETIINRKDKMGYTTPNNKWMAAISEDVKDIFTTNLNDVLNVNLIQKNYSSIFNNNAQAENGQTFKLISFAMWCKCFGL